MFSLVVQVYRLVRAVLGVVADPRGRALTALVAGQLLLGTVFYNRVEGWSLLDSLYFSVVVLTTIGFGDLVPVTGLGKVFTMFFALTGIGILAAFISLLAAHFGRRAPEAQDQGAGRPPQSEDA